MSTVLNFYPGDEIIASAALVLVAISTTAVTSLLISRLLSRRPTVQHAILAAALLCILLTPFVAVLMRASGKSLFVWNLLPATQSHDSQPSGDGEDLAAGEWLTYEGQLAPARHSIEPASIGAPHTAATLDRQRPAQMIEVAGSTTPANTAGRARSIRLGLTLAMIAWLAGCAVLLIRFVCGNARVVGILRSGKPLLGNSLQAIAPEVYRCLEIEHLPRILVSSKIQSPATAGALRGAVILPAELLSVITTDELCDVLVHECAHVVRRDPLMRNLQWVAGILFWPLPFVHWLNRQMSCACEEICDNYVLAHRDALHYAETLLRVATLVGGTRHSFEMVGMLHWRGKLESRIARLIDKNTSNATRIGRSRPALCLAAFLLASVAICGTNIRAARTDALSPLTGSEPASSDPQPAAEAVEIEVWWGAGGALNKAFAEQVNRFNELQDDLVVDVRLFDGYGQLHHELTKAFQDGDLPDAAIIETHQVASFAAAGQIQALDAFIKDNRTFNLDDLLPGILTNLRYQDALYALPMNRSTPILYYNKDRFVAAGLDPTRPPATWQEMRQMSRALTAADQKQYGFLAVSSPWVFESLVWSNGGELFGDGQPTFAKFAAAPLGLWADMVHRDHTAQFFAPGDRRAEFTSGRAAMAIDSTALLQEYLSQSDFAIATAPLPRSEGGRNAVPVGGGGAVIPAAISPERKAAVWRFLTWFTSTRQAARWSRETGYIPVRKSACNLLRAEGFYDQHPEFDVAIEQMKFAREAPRQWLDVWKIIAGKMTSVVGDDAPALQALEGAEKQTTRLLNSKDGSTP